MCRHSRDARMDVLDTWIHALPTDGLEHRYGKGFLSYLRVENGGLNFRNVTAYVRMVVENARPYGHVLDFGCGFGIHSVLFQLVDSDVTHITGCDIDAGKIETFSRLVQDLKLDGVYPQLVREGEPLPFPQEHFDTVYCNESLSHVSDVPQCLREMHRVLKVGGKLLVADTKKWNWWALYFVYLRGHRDEHYFTLSQMKQLLTSTGFGAVRRVKGIVAPRNLLRQRSHELWWLH